MIAKWIVMSRIYQFLNKFNLKRTEITSVDELSDHEYNVYLIKDSKVYLLLVSVINDVDINFKLYSFDSLTLIDNVNEPLILEDTSPNYYKVIETIWISPKNQITIKETVDLPQVPAYLNSKEPFAQYERASLYCIDKYDRICINITEKLSTEKIMNHIYKVNNFKADTYSVYQKLHLDKFKINRKVRKKGK